MKIKDIFAIVFIIAVFIAVPQSREMLIELFNTLWQSIKEIFLKDLIVEKVICIIVLVGANVLGFGLSKKQKGKVKYFIAGVLNLIGLYGFYQLYK